MYSYVLLNHISYTAYYRSNIICVTSIGLNYKLDGSLFDTYFRYSINLNKIFVNSDLQVLKKKMEVLTAKIIAMVLLMGVSLFLGFLPLKIGLYFLNDGKLWKKTLTSVLLCFGGGVLFATSFVHMLPEVCFF